MTDYLLAVLTHGADPEPLERSLAAFRKHVSPQPGEVYFHGDGPDAAERATDAARRSDYDWQVTGFEGPDGFCGATRQLWDEAAYCRHPYVLWLEHDFEVTRPVDVADLAAVLDDDDRVAQIALMRDAVNDAEKAAGGLYESRPGQYEPRWGTPTPGDELAPAWLAHTAYFTTNVNLMRTGFMQANPWPDYPAECEGRFGIDLVQRGYVFGVWGAGEPWCRHIGTRNGFGY